MENIVCQFCHQQCDEHVLLQCKHLICSKCVQAQFSFELSRTPCDQFPLNTEHKQEDGKQQFHDDKKTIDICCPKCNEKSILIFSRGVIKLSNDQQLLIDNDDGLGKNQQQQQHIPDEILQWMFQFLNAKELFTKIRFTCNRMDKIVITSLLSLHCQGLRINGLKFARTILPKETQLQELNLMANNISGKEATEIVKIFPLLQQLQILDLSWNRIGNFGAIAIANSVTQLKQLRILDISCNPIKNSGITAITNATKELTKLQQLDIYENSSKTIYERVQQMFNEKGTQLNLNFCDIDDKNAAAVAKILSYFTQLQRLRLGNNQIGDTGATAIVNFNYLTNLTQLQHLELYNNQIGDIGATAIANSLSNLTQLQELDLCYNQIGDAGAIAIGNSMANLTQLQRLNLSRNQIGDTGAIAIANSLTNLTQLQELSLAGNRIGDSGAIAIANSITSLTQLQKLYLNYNRIGDTGTIAIANSISNLTQLHLLHLHNNYISEPVKQQLKQKLGDKLRIFDFSQ